MIWLLILSYSILKLDYHFYDFRRVLRKKKALSLADQKKGIQILPGHMPTRPPCNILYIILCIIKLITLFIIHFKANNFNNLLPLLH